MEPKAVARHSAGSLRISQWFVVSDSPGKGGDAHQKLNEQARVLWPNLLGNEKLSSKARAKTRGKARCRSLSRPTSAPNCALWRAAEEEADIVTSRDLPQRGGPLAQLRIPASTPSDAATVREDLGDIPGVEEIRCRHAGVPWTCPPQGSRIPAGGHSQMALELREMLFRADEASLEKRFGRWHTRDAPSREVLLRWTLGCCLEALDFPAAAGGLFASCVARDCGNPVHPYNRGVCHLRAGAPRAASRDFDLAVSRCIGRDLAPPPLLLVRRALAGSMLPERQAEVWADFELVRRRVANMGASLRSIQRDLARDKISSFAQYQRMVAQAQPANAPHRHWAAAILARTFRQQSAVSRLTEVELESLTNLLRSTSGLSFLKPNSLRKCLPGISVHYVPAGQPLLPLPFWYVILQGSFDIVSFVPGEAPALPDAEKDPFFPEDLCAPLVLRHLGQRPLHTGFWGLTASGPDRDGWLLANDHGVTVARMSAECLKQLSRSHT